MRGAHSDVWCSKGTRLMEAELFAATAFAPCIVWPRTVMRGGLRKVNSGPYSVPKPARRTELCSRNSRFAAHLRCVSAKEGQGSQEGTGNHVWCPVPFCPCRWAPTPPGRRRRPMSTLTSSVKPLYRRKLHRQQTVKRFKAQPYRSASTLAISPRVILPSGRSVPSV